MKTYDQFINEARVEAESHAILQYYPHLRTWMVIGGALYRDNVWNVSRNSPLYKKRRDTIKVIEEIAYFIADLEKISIDKDSGSINDYKGNGGGIKGIHFNIKGQFKEEEDAIVKSTIIDDIFKQTVKELRIPDNKRTIVKDGWMSTPGWKFTGTLDENKERWEKFLEILKYKYRGNLGVKKYNL